MFNEQEETSPHSEDESVPFAEMLKRREEDKRRYQHEALQSLKLAKFGSKPDGEWGGESEQGNENDKQEIKEVRTKTSRKQSEDNYTKKLSASSLKVSVPLTVKFMYNLCEGSYSFNIRSLVTWCRL